MKTIDDETLKRIACVHRGCINYAAKGYCYCNLHLHGGPEKLPKNLAKRKLELDAEQLKRIWANVEAS